MPASGFCVPVPVTSGRTGAAGGGKFKKFKSLFFFFSIVKHCCFIPFHIHIVPSALSCALPAFCLFFLPGNLEKSMASKKRPFRSKAVLDRLENSDSKSEPLAELSDNDS
ncbi:unnamed protein product [Staurois parvus]|uniref:Uncharacterized protein n=1 Tax=Staurois parvus TaxID=386267 RepID=A0ABN9DEX3_9NEOB|nr:unnamed protein product [Staurois parvus]